MQRCLQYTGDRDISEGQCSGATNQLWRYDTLYKTIVNKKDPKLCVDWAKASGNNAVMHSCHGGYNQKWLIGKNSMLLPFEDQNWCLSSSGKVLWCLNKGKYLSEEEAKSVKFTIGSSLVSSFTRIPEWWNSQSLFRF